MMLDIIKPYLYAILAALILAGGYCAYETGRKVERTEWLTKQNADLVAANAKIVSLENAARTAEQTHADNVNAIATEYQGKLSNANKQYLSDLTALRAGTLRMRDPNGSVYSNGSCLSKVTPSPAGSNGSTGCELSGTAISLLLDLVNDADNIANQLTACQQIIKDDRAN